MTNQLIPVFESQINNETNLLCDARELHAFLQVGKRFASWITERIKEYGFVENQDFIAISQNREIGHGRGKKDYHLTLDTAKELAMVERNDKGREIRRYFIECEKRLRASFNQSTTNSKSTADDRTPLRDAINLLVSKKHILYPEAYSYVHQRFNVKHIDELETSEITTAVEYVHKLVLTGEVLDAPVKNGEQELMHTISLTDDELCNLAWLWKAAERMRSSIEEAEAPLRSLKSGYAASFYSMSMEYRRVINKAKVTLERETRDINPHPTWLSHSNWRYALESLRN